MHLTKNFKLSKTILSSIILLIVLLSSASCKVFETVCNPCAVKEAGGEPVYVSVTHAENRRLPQNFEIKIEFDNDVFKKSAKINYSDEISKNYNHNKSVFGNEISVKCSLKASKVSPELPEDYELFLITLETKKSIPKSETNLKITAQDDFENESQNIIIKVDKPAGSKSAIGKSAAALTKLIPSQGSLSPEFNPNVNEYSLDVSYDTKDITFDTDARNSCGIDINRHKLRAAGSTTDVFITVKGSARGEKNIYHVAVNRADKPYGENSKSRRGSDPRSILKQIIPRKKSSKNRKNKHKKYDTDEDYDAENDDANSNSKIFKEMEINSKENSDNNKGKLYSIIVLSSVLCLYAAYLIIKKKKQIKIKKEVNKISKK